MPTRPASVLDNRCGRRLRASLRNIHRLLWFFGFDARRLFRNVGGLPGFVRDLASYRNALPPEAFRVRARHLWPILHESRESAGISGGAYFHQDLWAARKIFERRPAHHLDIASRIDGFIGHLLVFMPVTIVDIRPIDSGVRGLQFLCADATELGAIENNSIDSVSSLHAAEHFGLGRYSDPVDPQACFRFMSALQRVLAPEGRLYFSVPVGPERCEFNAQRVFAVETILDSFPKLKLVSFSLVSDRGRLHENIRAMTPDSAAGHCCGLFEFTKEIRSTGPS